MVLRRHARLHGGRLHVRCTRKRGDESRASGRLRRVRVLKVAALRLESWGHATTLTRAVTELVGGRESHLRAVVAAMGIESAATTALWLEITSTSAVTLSRVARFTSEVSSRLCIGVRWSRALPHVAFAIAAETAKCHCIASCLLETRRRSTATG